MKKSILLKSIIAVIAISLLCSACSHKSDTHTNRASDKSETYNTASYAVSNQVSSEYTAGLNEEMVSEDISYDSISNETESGSSNGSSNSGDPIANSQMLIRTMSITADTQDFPGLSALVDSAVKSNGGYYESMNVTGTGTEKNYRHGYYVIRVPATNLDSLVMSLEGNVTVTQRSENTTDVTLEYVDTQSRIDSLRIEMDDLLRMLENATDMETIVFLQNEISSVRYQLQSYESQVRVMENQVNYSTLYLTLNEVIEEVVEEHIEEKREKTFAEELKEAWSDSVANLKENAKDGLYNLVSALPYIGIFCIIFLIVLIVVICFKSRKKKKIVKNNTVEPSK